jgi:hypothetical protein
VRNGPARWKGVGFADKIPEPTDFPRAPRWARFSARLLATHGGPTMMARIGVMRALNRHVVREFDPSRKDTHWGKRKLKRDQ